MSRVSKKERHDELNAILQENPFLTDEELSERLKVSIQTIRLDRLALGIPELRARMKEAATDNYVKVKTLAASEIVGELIDLELNNKAISFLETDGNMVFEKTQIVKGHYIFAMAESLAMAVIDADVAITGVANLKYKVPVKAGEKLVAKAVVTKQNKNEYYVHVMINVSDNQVFRSKFLLRALTLD